MKNRFVQFTLPSFIVFCSFVTSLLLSSISLSAQNGDSSQDGYVRNSLSYIVVDRGDRFDPLVTECFERINFGEKFDVNLITTQSIYIAAGRKDTVSMAKVSDLLEGEEVGKQLISYWFSRDHEGKMSDQRILSRGAYSAVDQDVLNAQAAKVGLSSIGEKGYDLIDKSYILVFDVYNMRVVSNTDKKGKTKYTYLVDLRVFVYNIDFTEDIANQVFDSWIYETDSAEEIERKKELYKNIHVPLVLEDVVSISGSVEVDKKSDDNYKSAIYNAFHGAFNKANNSIESWKVQTSIISTSPIKAKIGTKEGVSNGDRYQVFKYVEKENGDLEKKHVGYVRATDIAQNSTVATGASSASSFYQISGLSAKEGMELKQKHDSRMGISFAYGISGLNSINVGLDILASISTKGVSSYVLIDFGGDYISESTLTANGLINNYGSGVFNFSGLIGAGVSFRPYRAVEITPFAELGFDIMSVGQEISDDFFKVLIEWGAMPVKAGIRGAIQPIYPLQLFAQADVYTIILKGTNYAPCQEFLANAGLRKTSGAGISFGARIMF